MVLMVGRKIWVNGTFSTVTLVTAEIHKIATEVSIDPPFRNSIVSANIA